MPSKRTNDSVDRILQDLNRRQNEAGVQDTVTDHQVDEILRSVGITTAPLHGTRAQDEQIAFSDDLADLEDLGIGPATSQPTTPARPAPRQARQTTPASRTVTPAQSTPAPAPAQPTPAPTPAADTPSTDTVSDTTRTGIIKGFLRKMAPEGEDADTDALNQGKDQFKKFFEDSVAVVPDEKGHVHEPGKKRRGLFGLKSAEETDEFVPINVSLSGSTQSEEEPLPAQEQEEEEYFPDEEPAEAPAQPQKKRGFLAGLFGGHNASAESTEEIYIPEERQSEAPSEQDFTELPEPEEEPEDPTTELEDPTKDLWRSKYTRRAARAAAGPSTTYRKKRDTVEFVPGQEIKTKPEPQPEPIAEPVGEPITVPAKQPAPSTGFTMQLGGLGVVPSDSTQEFVSAYNAVRPRRAPQPEPAPVEAASVQAEPEPQPEPARKPPYPGGDPNADTAVVPLPGGQEISLDDEPEEEPTLEHLTMPHREPDEVDRLVDTLTGRIRLTPAEDAAETPAHTGFTQDLSGAAVPQPEHTGFTQDLGVDTPEPTQTVGTAGFTQKIGEEEAQPSTASFVRGIADSINSAPDEREARYDDAARRLTGDLNDEPGGENGTSSFVTNLGGLRDRLRGNKTAKNAKPGKGGIRLTGTAEDEALDSAETPFETTELPPARGREYERAEDAPGVRRALERDLMQMTVACLVVGAITAVLLVLGFMAAALPALPGPLASANVYPAVALILLIAACGVCWRTMLSGLRGLLKAPTPDSLAVLPALAAAVQCIVLLAAPSADSKLALMAGPAALVLLMNTIGKRLNACTTKENFSLVSAQVDHAVAYRLKDAGALRAVTQGLAEPHPSVLVSRPTQILRGFLAGSAAHGTSDKNQQQFSWLVGGCALAGLLFTLIKTKDAATAVTVLAAIACLGAPLAGTLLSALPMRLMQRSAAQVGAVVPGWRDIRQLGRINVIQVTARDLFPTGCITLAGIKPVKPEHIDLAIVYAASVLADAGPTLRDVFLGMLGENRDLLAQVDDRQTVPGKGYVGWINKRRVLVGNRALMQDYGVKIPSMEYERHHTVNQRRVIYLSVSGKLFAMFQVAYQRDADTAAVLDSLRHAGLSLVVDCDDFNCDVSLIETAYGLPSGAVKVLNDNERRTLAPAVAWLPESEGSMLHLGSFASFVGGLEAAAGAAEAEKRSATVVTASVLFGCALGVLLALTGGLVALPLPALVLYQAAWCVLALIFPVMQRY